MQYTILLAKLSGGDLISQVALYHNKCLVSLYNREKRSNAEVEDTSIFDSSSIALAELISYMEDAKICSNVKQIFKLADLAKLYSKHLEQLVYEKDTRVQSTNIKNRILANIPRLHAYKQGREVLLAFKDDIGESFKTFFLSKAVTMKQ